MLLQGRYRGLLASGIVFALAGLLCARLCWCTTSNTTPSTADLRAELQSVLPQADPLLLGRVRQPGPTRRSMLLRNTGKTG